MVAERGAERDGPPVSQKMNFEHSDGLCGVSGPRSASIASFIDSSPVLLQNASTHARIMELARFRSGR